MFWPVVPISGSWYGPGPITMSVTLMLPGVPLPRRATSRVGVPTRDSSSVSGSLVNASQNPGAGGDAGSAPTNPSGGSAARSCPGLAQEWTEARTVSPPSVAATTDSAGTNPPPASSANPIASPVGSSSASVQVRSGSCRRIGAGASGTSSPRRWWSNHAVSAGTHSSAAKSNGSSCAPWCSQSCVSTPRSRSPSQMGSEYCGRVLRSRSPIANSVGAV